MDRAHVIDRANMIDMAMRVNNIFGDQFEFRDTFQNAFSLIARVYDNRLVGLRTSIEVAVFLEIAHRYTGNNWHTGPRLLINVRHTVFLPPLPYCKQFGDIIA